MLNRTEFVNVCIGACENGTFVSAKHDLASLGTPFTKPRSINLMGNVDMADYLRSGDFKVRCYSDSESSHSPELYVIAPNDPSIVPGSGVPRLSPAPTTPCDLFAVPSGAVQGWHCYAYKQTSVDNRVSQGKLSLIGEPN